MIEKWNLEKANKRSFRTSTYQEYEYEDIQEKKDEKKETPQPPLSNRHHRQDWIVVQEEGEGEDILASESNELNENTKAGKSSPHTAAAVVVSSNKMVKSLVLPRPLIYANSNSSSASSSTSSSNTCSGERKSSTSSSSQSSSASYSDYSHFHLLAPAAVKRTTETITIVQTYMPNHHYLHHNQSITTPNKNHHLTEMSSNYVAAAATQPCHSLGTAMSTSSSNLSASTSPALSSHVGYLDKADHSIRVRKHLQNTLHRRHNSSCNLPAEPNSLGPNIKIENGRSLSPSSTHTCCHHHYCHHQKPSSNSINKRVNNNSNENNNTQNRQFLTIPSNTFSHSPILEWPASSTSQDESNDGDSSLDLCNPQQCRNATRSLCQSRSASIAHSPSTVLTTAALFRSFAAKARTNATSSATPINSLTKTQVPYFFQNLKHINSNLNF